ncbi:MAG: hypothetical protein U9R74_09455 [Pseudomonadota bacterium]|nr:hypothetical protein [Pseudomonadota bacterium]
MTSQHQVRPCGVSHLPAVLIVFLLLVSIQPVANRYTDLLTTRIQLKRFPAMPVVTCPYCCWQVGPTDRD